MDFLLSYSKRPEIAYDLAATLRKLTKALGNEYGRPKSVRNEHERSRVWVRDRLTDEDVERLVTLYHDGPTQRELVKGFQISRSTVKRLLREQCAQRRSSR